MKSKEIQEKKMQVTFHDKENNLVHIKIELNKSRFSMSGDCGGSCGQCYDEIKPTPNQEKLIEIWHKYHLNDMKAGTPEQEGLIKDCKTYDESVKLLKKLHKYTVTLKNGKKYEYGSLRLTEKLPKNLWGEVEEICKTIENDELQRKLEYERKGGSWKDLDMKVRALGKFLDMTPKEAEENISDEGDNIFNAEGIDYFVGNQEEVEERCRAYLVDDTELYSMWVQEQIKCRNASGIVNIDEWAEDVINSDGYGSILNHWDGTENYSSEYELYIIRT